MRFDPAANSYTATRTGENVDGRFGIDPGVTGSPGSPGSKPPADGISFDSPDHQNTLIYYAAGHVVPAGTIYLTNGNETIAVRVANTGRARLWRSKGGNKWEEI
jgi:hypothetical protein